jgi:hypothetical protein
LGVERSGIAPGGVIESDGTTIGTYLVWHITATLVWPQYFSPSLYIVTAEMIITAILTYVLLQRIYLLAQATCFWGWSSPF